MFDQQFRLHIPTDLLQVEKNIIHIREVRSMLADVGPHHALVNYLLDILFCDNLHDVPDPEGYRALLKAHERNWVHRHDSDTDISLLLKEGLIMKPTYLSWIVWRYLRNDDTAISAVQPLLDQIEENAKTCEDAGRLGEWRGHLRIREFRKMMDGGRALPGWYKERLEVCVLHLEKCEGLLEGVLGVVEGRIGELVV
ncbi:hypothetical protein HDV00_000516 [Rhizophlyctis rosea]|nr:hypothetical protein HDV00_000516 [Rhizophlyctis rosea]